MIWDEKQLREHLKKETLLPIYILYGEESYLSALYAERITGLAVDGDELSQFNLHRFDGDSAAADDIEAAAEALPLMAERSCVVVKDYNPGSKNADPDRIIALFANPPAGCVMIFHMGGAAEVKKTGKWKTLLAAAEKNGAVVEFPRKTAAELIKLLTRSAEKRGCSLAPALAKRMVEECGSDLNLLLNELDKLAALADAARRDDQAGVITAAHFEAVGVRNLEAKVFDLSKAILALQYTRAYEILHLLKAAREEPVMILGVLANAYADLYRVKTAMTAGERAEAVGQVFPYRGREFALRNAARDVARLPAETLRGSLEVLAQADRQMKSTRADAGIVLEQTAAKLIMLAKQARMG